MFYWTIKWIMELGFCIIVSKPWQFILITVSIVEYQSRGVVVLTMPCKYSAAHVSLYFTPHTHNVVQADRKRSWFCPPHLKSSYCTGLQYHSLEGAATWAFSILRFQCFSIPRCSLCSLLTEDSLTLPTRSLYILPRTTVDKHKGFLANPRWGYTIK